MTSIEAGEPIVPTRHRWARVVVTMAVWAALVAGWFAYQHAEGTSAAHTAQRLLDAAKGNWWAALAYLAASLIRPLLLFPATLVTVAAGILFGPGVGIAVAVVAANASAMTSYAVGRRFALDTTGSRSTSTVSGWADRLRRNSFEAVLVMRLLFLPYDLVNYGCGLLRIRRRPFLAATAIGSFPGTVAFVLIGASITRIDRGITGINTTTLLVSFGLIAASMIGSRLIHRTKLQTRRTGGPST